MFMFSYHTSSTEAIQDLMTSSEDYSVRERFLRGCTLPKFTNPYSTLGRQLGI